MKNQPWKPNVTVAAIVEQAGKFLLVEEETNRGLRFNQPAGHLEDNETLLQAVVREVFEETAYEFVPEAVLGIYHWKHEHNDTTYLRFAYIGTVGQHHPTQALDAGIVRAVWMSMEEMRAQAHLMRSPQVLTCVDDYLAGKRISLDSITHLTD